MRILFADGLFWSSVACCLVAQLCIVRSVRGVRHLPANPSAPHLPRQREWLELVWAIVPAIALAALLLFTWRAIHPAVTPAPSSLGRSGATPWNA